VAQIAIAERIGIVSGGWPRLDPRAFDPPRYKLTPKREAATAASLMKGAKGSSNLCRTTRARSRSPQCPFTPIPFTITYPSPPATPPSQ
jgi:hypothetical protein